MRSEVYNEDCMPALRAMATGSIDLAILDPPYGIGESKKRSSGKRSIDQAITTYKPKNWDSAVPPPEYFVEIFRVSKHQIIWGGNYFALPPMPKWIVWDKIQSEGIDQAMHELAWCSRTDVQAKIFRRSSVADSNRRSNADRQMIKAAKRIHPTQKPVPLYSWILQNYAEPGWLILDTHMGSQSSRIAAHQMGFDYIGYEIDPDYFQDGCARYELAIQQHSLFPHNSK